MKHFFFRNCNELKQKVVTNFLILKLGRHATNIEKKYREMEVESQLHLVFWVNKTD